MTLAEEIAKEQNEAYKKWKESHNENFTRFTKSEIKQYGHASVTCHGYGACKPYEREFVIRWARENGFHTWDSCTAQGAPTICWN